MSTSLNFINIGIQELIILFMFIIPIVIIIVISVFHVVSNQNISRQNRLLWLVLIVLAPLIGSLIYWLVGKNRYIEKNK
ncbi:PLDc N-terminal domain-containing protein [Sphingobacterium sp. UT-1RO-CII-1]|uniref:PLDc N-terminal domain-containing protein n=1 Tax=Sphingobacterium sp. UT-1RO-CII-1 TaxID=2995225 RepID=UPI003FA35964